MSFIFSVHSDQCLKELPKMTAGSWQEWSGSENQQLVGEKVRIEEENTDFLNLEEAKKPLMLR